MEPTDLTLRVLERAVDAATASARSYDTKAQIASVAYLLAIGVLEFGTQIQPGGPNWHGYLLLSAGLLFILLPVILFGWVLRPRYRLTGKALVSHKRPARTLTMSWFEGRSAHEIEQQINAVDWRAEYAFEIEKILKIRDQKQRRFLAGMYAALIVVLVFLLRFALK